MTTQDEFALLKENADEAGIPWNGPPAARQRQDGRWEWRYDRLGSRNDFTPLRAHISGATVPPALVRGGPSAFVPDADAEEFVRRNPGTRVHVVPGAGHSVQSDAPLALAGIIRGALRQS